VLETRKIGEATPREIAGMVNAEADAKRRAETPIESLILVI
jgi:hypothetical protein